MNKFSALMEAAQDLEELNFKSAFDRLKNTSFARKVVDKIKGSAKSSIDAFKQGYRSGRGLPPGAKKTSKEADGKSPENKGDEPKKTKAKKESPAPDAKTSNVASRRSRRNKSKAQKAKPVKGKTKPTKSTPAKAKPEKLSKRRDKRAQNAWMPVKRNPNKERRIVNGRWQYRDKKPATKKRG